MGATAAIITSMGLIAGLTQGVNAETSIITGLFIVAIADNISDSLGIHIYQESEGMKARKVWFTTFTNFFTRLLVSFGFILIIAVFPLAIATYIAVAYGLATLTVFSYFIAIGQHRKPLFAIFEHLCIAIAVIILSKFVGDFIIKAF